MKVNTKRTVKNWVNHNVKIRVQLTLVDRIINNYSPNKR